MEALSRVGSSCVVAICVAPMLFLGSAFFLGMTERVTVCSQRALWQGQEEVKQGGCGGRAAQDGELVIFSCGLNESSLPVFTPPSPFEFTGKFKGVGLRMKSEIYQCFEKVNSRTINGTTYTEYEYSMQWTQSFQDERAWQNSKYDSDPKWLNNCGKQNQPWPEDLAADDTQVADSVDIGGYTLTQDWVDKIPLDKVVMVVQNESALPDGWETTATHYVYRDEDDDVFARVQFKGNDMERTVYTVLGEVNSNTMSDWTADDSWMCSGYTVGAMRSGVVSKDDFFTSLEGQTLAFTWVFRVLLFFAMWCACCMCFKPFEVVSSLVPFVGDFLSSSVNAVIACVTCPVACSCALGVIGVMWVAMRPLVGVPLLILFCCGISSVSAFLIYAEKNKKEEEEHGGDVDPEEGGGDDVPPEPVPEPVDPPAPEPESGAAESCQNEEAAVQPELDPETDVVTEV